MSVTKEESFELAGVKKGIRRKQAAEAQTICHKTSYFETAAHLFKGSVGAGLFAMGDAFKNGGLIGATVMLPAIAVICVHCEQMLITASVRAVAKTQGSKFLSYPETVQRSFELGPARFHCAAKLMRVIVEAFLCITQFGFCSIYFVFIADSLLQVFNYCGLHLDFSAVMTISLTAVLVPSLITNLKYLAPVSMLASVFLVIGVTVTLVIALCGELPVISERNYTTTCTKTALFFGTAIFSYEGVALILPLRNAMKRPEDFNSRFGVLNSTMAVITALFIFTGFVGYMRWGEDVEGSLTLNLNSEDWRSQAVKVVAAVGVFFGYPLQFHIMIQIVWPLIQNRTNCCGNPLIGELCFRTLMILLTFFMALVVPQLGLFISLIGALCSTSLSLLIPVLVDFVVPHDEEHSRWYAIYFYLKNMFILILAMLGTGIGTYQSVADILDAFQK